MLRMFGLGTSPMRLLGIAAAATLMLSAGTARRAEALSLINPATSPATKAATDDLVTQVRHGGGHGGHGGGFHGGGFRGGGFHGGGHIGGFRGGGFHRGHIGGFRAAPAFRHSHVGGYRYGGVRYGGYGGYHRHWGYHRPHYGYRHFHRRYYVGGYYPYYHYPRRCRIIWTYYGPRRVCRWPRWHYPYRYW
ncbi:hypothetical protein [Bradyrhizobium sp. CCBAU 53415]|uniref:hypothetical protein n=1 Tax=Bradyrhizobium sp. CCBAU 53415 TaxID=1325119 RepID=UPI002305FF2D|nr:hypothetical protein [Bradyrhizobium sp. CCBAU 53415]MDA9464225.1 hypothetical protein [Bradyrhizobium sp. CCBAU 53415]